MAREKRVRQTKELLYQALKEMLRTKPLEEITVSDICSQSGVTRSTFYRHYKKPYDLLLELYTTEITEFETSIDPPMSPRERLTDVLIIIREDPNYNLSFNHLYMREILKGNNIMSPNDNFSRIFLNQMHPDTARYFSSVLAAVLQQWLRSGMKESPEEIASLLIDLAEAANHWKPSKSQE